MTKIPDLNIPRVKTKVQKRREQISKLTLNPYAFKYETATLQNQFKDLTAKMNYHKDQILLIKKERLELMEVIKKRTQLRKVGKTLPVSLYVLRLEDNCWYVGMTYNVQRRFQQHVDGKGANWTRLHKPLEIVETRITEEFIQEKASKLEDVLTIEYAKKYGLAYVRGGGYCQMKPRWPNLT